jgi:integrase
MAVVKHRKKFRVEIYQNQVRVYRSKVYDTELDARIHEREILENLEAINTGFVKLCEKRLEELELKRSEKHFNENLTLLKNLMKRWGRKQVISRDDVETYLNEVSKESKSKANKRLRLIKALFNHGIKRGWIRHNPCQGIERFPESKGKKYIPPIEDLKLVLEVSEAPGCIDKMYLLVLIHTAGRMRAVNRLKWEDVDFERGFVTLYTRKAKSSDLKPIRVSMNDDLRKALLRVPRTIEIKEVPTECIYVFTNPKTGTAYDHRDKFLHTLCKMAGVNDFTYHCIRHFTASALDDGGAPLTAIQGILGHEKPTTTDHYLQSLRGSQNMAIKKLEGIV